MSIDNSYIDQQLQQLQQEYLSHYRDDNNYGSYVNKLNNSTQTAQQLKDLLAQNTGLADKLDQKSIYGYLGGDPVGTQAVNELVHSSQQLSKQNAQLQDFRNKFETQAFGAPGATLEQALASNTGDLGQLNKFLGQQEADTFNTQLKPLIQMALGSQGLSDSGAQVELQSKALAQLEQQRQQGMMQAALGYRSQAQGLERSDILGDVGAQNQALSNMFDLQRAGITMQFQQQLEQQREQLARELSGRRGGGGLGGLIGSTAGMALGGGLGFLAGGPGGAMLGASLGGGIGGGIGGAVGGNGYGGAGLGTAGAGLFAQAMNYGGSSGGTPQARRYAPAGGGTGQYGSPINLNPWWNIS